MFGTMRPVINKMNKEEKRIFKSYYCGLCSSLGKFSGIVARLGLSYDITFMYMLLDACNDKEYDKCFCPSNPFVRKRIVKDSGLSEYLAAISVILMYEKCIDNVNDGDNILLSTTVKHLLKKSYGKAESLFPQQTRLVKEEMAAMRRMEQEGKADAAVSLAHCFGNMSGKLLGMYPKATDADVNYTLGYWVGRWIYIVDAVCDIYEDEKRGRFNPFILNSEKRADEILENNRDFIGDELFNAHDCIVDILRLSDIKDNSEEIENIIKLSLLVAEGKVFNSQKESSYGK